MGVPTQKLHEKKSRLSIVVITLELSHSHKDLRVSLQCDSEDMPGKLWYFPIKTPLPLDFVDSHQWCHILLRWQNLKIHLQHMLALMHHKWCLLKSSRKFDANVDWPDQKQNDSFVSKTHSLQYIHTLSEEDVATHHGLLLPMMTALMECINDNKSIWESQSLVKKGAQISRSSHYKIKFCCERTLPGFRTSCREA